MAKQIAIVGTGPAGMAAAQILIKDGFDVTMYDKADRPGGILMYGIPHMKINKNIIMKRAKMLEDSGVKFVLNTNVTKQDIATKIQQNYDAVLLATGAEKARDLTIDGRHLNNIYFAMEYLTDNTKHLLDGSPLQIDAKDKRVVIIGGGDTADDCVATAILQGATSVRQLEIMPKKPNRKKSAYDFNEEEIRLYQKTAVKFMDSDGCVSKILTDQVSLVRDENGTQIEFENQHGEMDADIVIVAIGFLGPLEEALEAFNIDFDPKKYNKDTTMFQTNQPNVFICGDARRGQSLIKWAIGEGKMAAASIKEYLTQ